MMQINLNPHVELFCKFEILLNSGIAISQTLDFSSLNLPFSRMNFLSLRVPQNEIPLYLFRGVVCVCVCVCVCVWGGGGVP